MGTRRDETMNNQLVPIDPTAIKQPPIYGLCEELIHRCRVFHITQILQATMVRVTFDKSLRAQSSGVRMLDGDHFTLRVKYELNTENPPTGLRLRHWNGGFAEYATEKALSPEDECVDLNLTFSARDENGKEIKDSEEHIPMRTQVVDAEGNCYAQVDWFTGINDFFD